MKYLNAIKSCFIIIIIMFMLTSTSFADNTAISTTGSEASATGIGSTGGVLNGSLNSTGGMPAVVPGAMPVSPSNGYLLKPNRSVGYMPSSVFTIYRKWFTRASLREMQKTGHEDVIDNVLAVFRGHAPDVTIDYSCFDKTIKPANNTDANGDQWLYIIVTYHDLNKSSLDDIIYKNPKDIGVHGMIQGWGTTDHVMMPKLIGKAGEKVLDAGGNVLQIIADGYTVDIFSRNNIFGLTDTLASLFNAASRTNAVTAGGSSGSTRTFTDDVPWLIAYAITDDVMVPPIMQKVNEVNNTESSIMDLKPEPDSIIIENH